MKISASQARDYVADIERRYETGRIKWVHDNIYTAEMGDDDYIAESMLFDALYDVPNSTW